MSVHKHIKRQKIYKPNRYEGEKSNYWPTEGHLPGYSGYIVSTTAFVESLKPLNLNTDRDGQLSKLYEIGCQLPNMVMSLMCIV